MTSSRWVSLVFLSPRVAWQPLSCVGCPHGSIGVQVWRKVTSRMKIRKISYAPVARIPSPHLPSGVIKHGWLENTHFFIRWFSLNLHSVRGSAWISNCHVWLPKGGWIWHDIYYLINGTNATWHPRPCRSWRLVTLLGIRSGVFLPPIKEAPNRHKVWNLVAKTALSPWICKLNYTYINANGCFSWGWTGITKGKPRRKLG